MAIIIIIIIIIIIFYSSSYQGDVQFVLVADRVGYQNM